MKVPLATSLVVAFLLGACGNRTPPPATLPGPTKPAPVSSAEGASKTGIGLGSETDPTDGKDFGRYQVTQDTYLCVKRHAILTLLRNRDEGEEREWQRLLSQGKTVIPIKAGETVKRIRPNADEYAVDGVSHKMIRVELESDPSIHASIKEDCLAPIK